MFHFDGDFPAPVAAEAAPCPDCDRQADQLHSQARGDGQIRDREKSSQRTNLDDLQDQGEVPQQNMNPAR